MEPKILFTDLDDTLLNSDKIVTKDNIEAMNQMLNAGHKLVLNTGRPLLACKNVENQLDLKRKGCFISAFNGGQIYDCYTRKTLYKRTIPIEYTRHIFHETGKAGIYCQTYSNEGVLAREMTPELSHYVSETHTPYKIIQDLPDCLEEEPVKILAVHMSDDRSVLDSYRKALSGWAADKISTFYSDSWYLEHVPYGISKGSAVSFLCRHLNIPMSLTVAVGDEENDIAMIKTAHVGAAMSNATSQVKSCSNYITKNDCNHSGVAEIIDRFIL